MVRSIRDPILDKEIDFEYEVPELEKSIKGEPDARTALETLERLGCDRKQILRRLVMYGCGSAKDVQAVKGAFLRRRTYVLKLSKRLTEVASEIEMANKYLADAGIDLSSPVSQQVQAHAEFLERMGNTILKDLSSQRISGRDPHLVFLAEMVKSVTGDPHYKELADLVNVGRLTSDKPDSLHTAGSMRKLIERFGPLDLAKAIERFNKDHKSRTDKKRRHPKITLC